MAATACFLQSAWSVSFYNNTRTPVVVRMQPGGESAWLVQPDGWATLALDRARVPSSVEVLSPLSCQLLGVAELPNGPALVSVSDASGEGDFFVRAIVEDDVEVESVTTPNPEACVS
jgi:hypothetical protein